MKVFVNIYLAKNIGDDLFLDILLKKYSNTQFTLNYIGDDYDLFLRNYSNVLKRSEKIHNKIFRKLKIADSSSNENTAKKYDALLYIGGSIFMETNNYRNNFKDKFDLFFQFKTRNKPIYILGSNFGPYISKDFLLDHMELFKLCNDVCFRDKYSYELFKHLPQVRYAPDIVFQLEVDKYKNIEKEKKVGFSIINFKNRKNLKHYHDEYRESIVNSINMFHKIGYKSCLMSFCEKEGDLEAIEEIKDYLSIDVLKNIITYNYHGILTDSISVIASFDLFVATRFHANILSILLGIPVLPIIYSDKTQNMLKDIKFGELLINMNNLHLLSDINTVNKAFHNKKDVKQLSLDATKHFDKLEQFLME